MNYILSIVICVYNKYNFTKSCLNDLFKLPSDTHEIIIVDNASSDITQQELLKLTNSNFVYIRNEENLFHSKACNQGYNIAKGKNILFINNDIRVNSNHNNWTNEIIKYCDTGLVGPTMGQLDNKLNFVRETNMQLVDGNSYLSGWCVGSSKQNWEKLNIGNREIFNERYPFHFNDGDLSFRARKLGIPLKVVSLPITHFGKVSTSPTKISKLYNDGRKVFVGDWGKLK